MSDTPKPRYKGSVVCPYCHAEYIRDSYQRLDKKTGKVRTVEPELCPWCCKPRPRKDEWPQLPTSERGKKSRKLLLEAAKKAKPKGKPKFGKTLRNKTK